MYDIITQSKGLFHRTNTIELQYVELSLLIMEFHTYICIFKVLRYGRL